MGHTTHIQLAVAAILLLSVCGLVSAHKDHYSLETFEPTAMRASSGGGGGSTLTPAQTYYHEGSGEEMWMGVKSYNSDTRTYTFGCLVPPGSGDVQSYYWSIRPDTDTNEFDTHTAVGELTYTLSKDVLYHIGCQAHNGSQLLRGDFHLDFRSGPNVGKPNIEVLSYDHDSITLRCTPPTGVTNYNMYWTMLSIHGQISFPEFKNQQTVTFTAPEPLIWDFDCGIEDVSGGQAWSQWGLPIEFYTNTEAYIAGTDGCLPDGYCPHDAAGPSNPPACTPSAETCDGNDNDCDGLTDEGNVCTPPPPPPSNQTCFNSVQGIPASCTGGIITSDTFNGCRQIICSGSNSRMQVLACDKGSSFEMYKQSQSGTAVRQVCIGSTCIRDNGFARSDSFPVCTTGNATNPPPTCTASTEICDGNDNDCDGLTDEGNVCTPPPPPPPSNQTCFSSVQHIPLSCTGTITTDSWNGCRSVECSSGAGTIKALACDKTGSFEVYKQSQSGVTPELCFADTCIQGSGFAKSGGFPVCTAAGDNQTNQPPQPPTWLEPSAGKADMDVYDFHIHAHDMIDAEGDAHIATDFELWDDQANQRVWHSTFNTDILYHIHNGDGTFVGKLAGADRLDYDTAYRLRARFHTADGQSSEWSAWRHFRTKQQVFASDTEWSVRDGYHMELVADNIPVPVNIALAPELYGHLPIANQPHLYVTNLYGQITMITKNGNKVLYAEDLLNYETFGSLPGSGENGVIGLYVDPATGDLFVSLTYERNGAMYGKVERFISSADGDGYTSREIILEDIPTSPAHQPQQITRGPDGLLYLSTGDADNPASAADPHALTGKILRFHEDGSMPVDNPWPGTYTYALGFRNAFGTDWRPGTNELFITNNGPDHNDGVFKVTRGFVGGWKNSGDTSANTWHLWPQTVAPTAIVFSDGTSNFPASTTGNAFAALSGATYSKGPSANAKRIVELTVNADGTNGGQSDLVRYTGSGYSAPIGLAFGDDGLYFTDMYGDAGFVGFGVTNGRIYRIAPGEGSGGTNTTTPFSAGLAPARWYPQGTNVVWECKGIGGSGNYKYDYIFGDGERQLNTASESVYHTYPANGTYTAQCTVHDQGTSQSATASTTIALGTQSTQPTQPPPTCTPTAESCDGKDNDCDGQTDENSVCSPPPASGASADLQIAPWFPQGTSYVFVCATQGFTPTSYDWSFGDGDSQRTTASDVYHTYAQQGSYSVQCTAAGTTHSATDSLQVTVS